jgi:hypothetical protein
MSDQALFMVVFIPMCIFYILVGGYQAVMSEDKARRAAGACGAALGVYGVGLVINRVWSAA